MRRISAVEKWSYAIGNIPQAVKDAAFGSFVIFFYTQVLGLSGTLAGFAMLIAMIWDAISDPLVGSWCDGIRSRFGRRHPLLLAGGVPTAFFLLLLFNPPANMSENGVFIWLVVMSLALRTAITIYYIPYQAMGAEMSEDYDERTVIAKSRVTVAFLGGMALPAIAYTFIFQAVDEVDGRLNAENYLYFGIMSCAMALISALICVWGTRTTIPNLPTASDSQGKFSLQKTISDLKIAASNHNFRATMLANLAFGVCAGTYSTLSLYMATYFWEFSTNQLAGFVIPTLLGTITAFSIINRVGNRYDKDVIFSAICFFFAINVAWFVSARLLGLLPENGHPVLYAVQLLQVYLGIFLMASLGMIAASLIADILDEHEGNTGLRQEGVFFAASSFVTKATTGVGSLAAGIAVDISGLQPGQAPGEVANSVLVTLGVFYGPGIGCFCLIAWFCARKIKLSREQVKVIQKELLAKKSTAVQLNQNPIQE